MQSQYIIKQDRSKVQAFLEAACSGDLESLRRLGSALDEEGKGAAAVAPLIHAGRLGRLEAAEYLLDHGADPSAASNMGATALHHAAGIGHIELMKLLLGKGVDVESESDTGTPLVWAAGHGQQEAVKLLLEHNAKERPAA